MLDAAASTSLHRTVHRPLSSPTWQPHYHTLAVATWTSTQAYRTLATTPLAQEYTCATCFMIDTSDDARDTDTTQTLARKDIRHDIPRREIERLTSQHNNHRLIRHPLCTTPRMRRSEHSTTSRVRFGSHPLCTIADGIRHIGQWRGSDGLWINLSNELL